MNTNINDVIKELDRIGDLLTRFYHLDTEINDLENGKFDEQKAIYNEYHPDPPANMPVFETLQPLVPPFRSSNAKGIKIGLFGFAAALLVFIVGKLGVYSITGYGFLGMIVFLIWFIMSYRKYTADQKEHAAKVARRNKFIEIISQSHAQDVIAFQAALDDYYTQHQLFKHKYFEYLEEYDRKHDQLEEEIREVMDTLKQVTLLSEDHLGLCFRISAILKSGRADTLKEALNLAISEKRDEEFKAQQLAEEARRTAIAEQQAYENRMHNERMEREAARQTQIQTQQAQAQTKIAQEQLRATQKQNEQLKEILDGKRRR